MNEYLMKLCKCTIRLIWYLDRNSWSHLLSDKWLNFCSGKNTNRAVTLSVTAIIKKTSCMTTCSSNRLIRVTREQTHTSSNVLADLHLQLSAKVYVCLMIWFKPDRLTPKTSSLQPHLLHKCWHKIPIK